MTIYFPDIASYQAGIDLSQALAVIAKATQGTSYFNPYYQPFKDEAAKHSTYFVAYHFLTQGNGSGQADYAHARVGTTPLMLDFEPVKNWSTGVYSSKPTVADAVAFVDRYRADGGKCYLLYFPRWYWDALGKPSLQPFIDRGMLLVSSNYSAFSDADSGAGWQPYGGMTPAIWQYTSTMAFGGIASVDFNAFRGSAYAGKQDDASVAATLAELKSLATTGKYKPEEIPPVVSPPKVVHPLLQRGSKGDAVLALQKRLNAWGADIREDKDFGPATQLAVEAVQTLVFGPGPDVDGIVGPKTWAVLDRNPLDVPWTYGPPQNLMVRGGRTSVLLEWHEPANALIKPDHYAVYVYRGRTCNQATLVETYPRYPKSSPYLGGHLARWNKSARGNEFTVHVVACGPNGTHVKPYVYVSARFRISA